MEGKDVTPKAPAKAPEPKAAAQEAEDAPAADDQMKANFLSDLEKAKQAQHIAKGAKIAAASKMFAFYLNLLSPESKYAWNKIVSEQTERDPYVNLQGDALQGPRRMSRQSFLNCVMFHLLTAFPINAAEQEKYYITNVLKATAHQRTSDCTSSRAAQCLHPPDALLLLQPKRQCQREAQECSTHRG
jgi:hypothetical protein